MIEQKLCKNLSKTAPDTVADKKCRNNKKAGIGARTKKVHSIGRFPNNLRNYTTPFERKVTHPFVTGSGRTHNVGIKLQILGKTQPSSHKQHSRRQQHRPHFPNTLKNHYKGWIESPEGMEWSKKVKEMFVTLHNDFAALIQLQKELKKPLKEGGEGDGEDTKRKLTEVEEKLEKKELQIQVAVKLYDENQKLKEEVQWLRKNIRPGRRRRATRPANPQNKHT